MAVIERDIGFTVAIDIPSLHDVVARAPKQGLERERPVALAHSEVGESVVGVVNHEVGLPIAVIIAGAQGVKGTGEEVIDILVGTIASAVL